MNRLMILSPEFAHHPALIVAVFVAAGMLGGFVGYLMNNASVKWRRTELFKSLMFGTLVSGAGVLLLAEFYSELFIPTQADVINLVLTGCICFMFSVVILMFGYPFLMRLTLRRKSATLKIR